MKSRFLLRRPAAFLLLAACACHAAAVHAAGAAACAVAHATFGAAELACPIEASAQPQSLYFSVSFQGVHDDSSAGMAARLDGQELACTPGSHTRLQGEETGDTLSCGMLLPPARGKRELRLQLVWFHADPAPYTLLRE